MNSRFRIGSFAVAAAAVMTGLPAAVPAAPQAACSVLPLAEVRAIVRSPVVIYEPSSEGPTVRGGHTASTCVYFPPGKITEWRGRGSASIALIWGSASDLATGYDAYQQRHWIARIKGDVLATASVSNGTAIDRTAAAKLLDAVLKNVR